MMRMGASTTVKGMEQQEGSEASKTQQANDGKAGRARSVQIQTEDVVHVALSYLAKSLN